LGQVNSKKEAALLRKRGNLRSRHVPEVAVIRRSRGGSLRTEKYTGISRKVREKRTSWGSAKVGATAGPPKTSGATVVKWRRHADMTKVFER